MQRSAVLSEGREYRYVLERIWDQRRDVVLWVMLNPSTADENRDDATIRRCIAFSQSWGYGGLAVGNLFAVRSTDPGGVIFAGDPVGPENDWYLESLASTSAMTVCAWGGSLAGHSIFQDRVSAVRDLLMSSAAMQVLDTPAVIHCLGINADGTPKHPVRLPGDTRLRRYIVDVRGKK